MSPITKTLAATTLTVAAVVCVAGFGWQRRSLDLLKEEKNARLAEMRTAVRASHPIPAQTAPSDPGKEKESGGQAKAGEAAVSTRAEAPLTPEERIELMRLRSRVTDLKEKQRALAGIRRQHADLQAKLSSASNYVRGTLPAGYVRRAAAKNQGSATPEGAMETFLWAMEHRNIEVLKSLMPAAQRQEFGEHIARQGADSFFSDVPAFPGFAVRSREEQGPDRITLELEMAPGKSWKVKLERQNGAWSIEDM